MTATTDASRRPGAREGRPDGSDSPLLAFLRLRMGSADPWSDDIPKHARLRRLVVEAIDSGALRHDDRLPAEQELAQLFAMSLGTVRRALGQLVTEGLLVRVQGRGTFVADVPRPFFRFLDHANRVVSVRSRIVDRKVIANPGRWSQCLGDDPLGWVCIRRQFVVDDSFTCFSDFYVGATRFGDMLTMPLGEDARLKRVLGEVFHAPVTSLTQYANLCTPPLPVAELIGMRSGQPCLQVEATSFGVRNNPVCFQMNWIPPSRYRLELADTHRSPGGSYIDQ